MQTSNSNRFLSFCVLAQVVLVALTLVQSAKAAGAITLEVAAGNHDREGTVVSVAVPPLVQEAEHFTLTQLDNGQVVPVQVDRRGDKGQLVWILPDKLPAGKTRLYRLAPASAPVAATGGVTVQDDGKRLVVQAAGKPVLAYNHAVVPTSDPKLSMHARNGYLHPIYNPAGQVVTDDLNPDHGYHHGIWFAWRHNTFDGHATDGWYETTKTGRLEHVKTDAFGDGPVFGHFTVRMHQLDTTSPQGEKPILDDTWRVAVYRFREYFLFDLECTQTCAAGKPVTVDKCDYGGMAIRGHKDWHDPAKSKSDYLTDEGKDRKGGNHTRPRWCDLHGQLGGQTTGITVLDHPGNYRFPQPVRLHPAIPYFCFAPAVLGSFAIEPGKPYVSRYRFLIHNGELDRALADRLWQDYAQPPVVTVLPATKTGQEKPPAAPYWLVRPCHTEPKILAWARKYPQLVSLEKQPTFSGRTAYAVTVTNSQIDNRSKRKLLVTQPHSHEPATVAGMMDFLSQLLDGVHLDGQPSTLKRQEILDRMLITLIPCGNPDGLAQAPEDWWDGSKYFNLDFLKVFFGRELNGQMSPRVNRFHDQERQVGAIGISYERINQHEYVEPNRDTESSYFKLILRANEKYAFDAHLDLHQTEFEKSKYNAMMILPFLQAELPEPLRRTNQRLGDAIVAAWQAAGATPIPEVKALGYGEDQLRYFRKCWGDIYRARSFVCVEVQNNNVRTPARTQLELMEVAIRTTIDFLLASR